MMMSARRTTTSNKQLGTTSPYSNSHYDDDNGMSGSDSDEPIDPDTQNQLLAELMSQFDDVHPTLTPTPSTPTIAPTPPSSCTNSAIPESCGDGCGSPEKNTTTKRAYDVSVIREIDDITQNEMEEQEQEQGQKTFNQESNSESGSENDDENSQITQSSPSSSSSQSISLPHQQLQCDNTLQSLSDTTPIIEPKASPGKSGDAVGAVANSNHADQTNGPLVDGKTHSQQETAAQIPPVNSSNIKQEHGESIAEEAKPSTSFQLDTAKECTTPDSCASPTKSSSHENTAENSASPLIQKNEVQSSHGSPVDALASMSRARTSSGSFVTARPKPEDDASGKRYNANFRQIMKQIKNTNPAVLSEEQKITKLRALVVEEILTTETKYLEDLKTCITYFIKPIRQEFEHFFQASFMVLNVQFATIERIYELNSKLFEALIQTKSEQVIGEVFLKAANEWDFYAVFCNQQEETMEKLTSFAETNSHFATLMNKCREASGQRLGLQDFIAKPFQRLLKYPLLLRELIKYTKPESPDYSNLSKALVAMQKTIDAINSNKSHSDNLKKMLSLTDLIIGGKQFNIVHPGRKYVMEGMLTKISHNKPQQRKCYLFSDVFLYCKEVVGGKLKLCGLVPLVQIEIEDAPDTKVYSHAIRLQRYDKMASSFFRSNKANSNYLLCCSDAFQKKQWLQAFLKQKESNPAPPAFVKTKRKNSNAPLKSEPLPEIPNEVDSEHSDGTLNTPTDEPLNESTPVQQDESKDESADLIKLAMEAAEWDVISSPEPPFTPSTSEKITNIIASESNQDLPSLDLAESAPKSTTPESEEPVVVAAPAATAPALANLTSPAEAAQTPSNAGPTSTIDTSPLLPSQEAPQQEEVPLPATQRPSRPPPVPPPRRGSLPAKPIVPASDATEPPLVESTSPEQSPKHPEQQTEPSSPSSLRINRKTFPQPVSIQSEKPTPLSSSPLSQKETTIEPPRKPSRPQPPIPSSSADTAATASIRKIANTALVETLNSALSQQHSHLTTSEPLIPQRDSRPQPRSSPPSSRPSSHSPPPKPPKPTHTQSSADLSQPRAPLVTPHTLQEHLTRTHSGSLPQRPVPPLPPARTYHTLSPATTTLTPTNNSNQPASTSSASPPTQSSPQLHSTTPTIPGNSTPNSTIPESSATTSPGSSTPSSTVPGSSTPTPTPPPPSTPTPPSPSHPPAATATTMTPPSSPTSPTPHIGRPVPPPRSYSSSTLQGTSTHHNHPPAPPSRPPPSQLSSLNISSNSSSSTTSPPATRPTPPRTLPPSPITTSPTVTKS
ncbi:calmodulin-binding protein [Pelomyxa schiedti]|nr:calmodulin-binding protein [Pelomyxa schiedti]